MIEHTPGPWEAQERAVYQVDGFGLAYCEGNKGEANACLMAAAPDMLEALERVEKLWPDTIKGVRSAINKAKGEE